MSHPASSFTNSMHLWLKTSSDEQIKAWKQSQCFSTPSRCWVAYLNNLSLNAFLPWLQIGYAPNATPFPNVAALPSFWEVVNGTAISFGDMRLVLIPSEAIDLSELRVPQEWVDIPNWVADYYLAVQVDPEACFVRVWGYATHEQLKSTGDYDASDRAYCLDGNSLIANPNVLWMARQLHLEEITRYQLAPLPELSRAQTENLLKRLGDASTISPRTAVPFEMWGALLQHGGWRQKLYELRLGIPQQWSVRQWVQTGVSDLASNLGWVRMDLQANLMGARGVEQASLPSLALVRKLAIAGQPYLLLIQPKGELENLVWRFELRRANEGELVPTGFKLRLLTEDLQPFDGNLVQAKTPTSKLYIEVQQSEQEGLVWEVEPIPENYDREILFF